MFHMLMNPFCLSFFNGLFVPDASEPHFQSSSIFCVMSFHLLVALEMVLNDMLLLAIVRSQCTP